MAASSSLQNPDNVAAETFIGSHVSLTTKSDIRYEGFVFRIDTQTSSIFLENVKSFGTEGRITNGPRVRPSNIIIDCMVFHSNDLKDLKVKSLSGVRDPTALPDDPAIIHARLPIRTSNLSLGFHAPNHQSMAASRTIVSFTPVPPLNNYQPPLRSYLPSITRLPAVGTSYPQFHSYSLQQPIRQPFILTTPYSGPPSSSSHRPLDISSFEPNYDSVQPSPAQSSHEPIAKAKAEDDSNKGMQKAGETKLLPEPQSIRMDEAASSSHNGNRRYKVKSQVDGGKSQAYESYKDRGQGQGQGLVMHEATSSHNGNKRHIRSQAYQNHNGHGHRETSENTVLQPITRFTEDFDFAAMNQKFNKAEIWDLLSKNNPSGAVDEKKCDENDANKMLKLDQLPAYLRDDHFFDSISCQQQKTSSSELDKLNAETFGVQNPLRDRVLRSYGQGRSSRAGSYLGRGSKSAGKSHWRAAH